MNPNASIQTKPLTEEDRTDLEESIRKMKEASSSFYSMAVFAGNHAFIEFTGLMNEYIKLCEVALASGNDFRMLNVHTGTHLPFQSWHFTYLSEKLECIYGAKINLETPIHEQS